MRPGTRQIGALYGSPEAGIPFISGGRARVSSSLSHIEGPAPRLMLASTVAGQLAEMIVSALPGATTMFRLQAGGLNRWNLQRSSNSETGGNAGSYFQLRALTDDGASTIDVPLQIERAAAALITIGGGGRPITLALTNQGLRLNGQASGAGAAVGTLNNAPVAGNPAFWLPLSIAGTVRYFPGW